MKRTMLLITAIFFILGPSLFAQRRPGPDPRVQEKRREAIRETQQDLRRVQEELSEARSELKALRRERQELEKSQPRPRIGDSRKEVERKRYGWRRELAALDARIDRKQKEIARLEDKEKDLGRQLAKLEDEERKSQQKPPPRERR